LYLLNKILLKENEKNQYKKQWFQHLDNQCLLV
jgi:hypothetical protein